MRQVIVTLTKNKMTSYFKLLVVTICYTVILLFQQIAICSDAENAEEIQVVKNALSKDNAEIDLLSTLLVFEKIIDANIKTDKVQETVESISESIQNRFKVEDTTLDKITKINNVLYFSGGWNDHNPFQYDFEDPLGTKLQNKLVSNYVQTKRGNCVSMPFLYLVIAHKLGLEVTLAAAPLHFFVMVKDPKSNSYFFIETTDKGQITNPAFYKEKLNIKEDAIKNGVYLKPLSKKEVVATMGILVSEYYAELGKWEQSILISETILSYYPSFAYAMIKIGNGYYKILSSKIAEVRGTLNSSEKEHLDLLYSKNLYWFNKAEKLGWKAPTQKENEEYLEQIKRHIE